MPLAPPVTKAVFPVNRSIAQAVEGVAGTTTSRCRGARTVIDEIFRRIVTWFAPILCFTMEEAWTMRFGMGESVHLNDFFPVPKQWADSELVTKWGRIRELRKVVTGALEVVRANKEIGSSLEASIALHVSEPSDKALFDAVDLAELTITSCILRP